MITKRFAYLFIPALLICCAAKAQYQFLIETPKGQRVQALWSYCNKNAISDKDSVAACRWYTGVASVADSLHDDTLKNYAIYFRMCLRSLFSVHYQQYFPPGDYESAANVFRRAKVWAQQNKLADITAACEHNIGEVYFAAARYGLAFEHLLKADEAFRKIGYPNVPGASRYLYNLAADYYRFDDYNKALSYFTEATQYPFYESWVELSTFHTISLIYTKENNPGKAVAFYRKTVDKARFYNDTAWIGIASGNLGNIFLSKGQNDSALFYSRKNYTINISRDRRDASKSALTIAAAFIRLQQPDSVLYYIHSGEEMARESIHRPEEQLEYKRRLLSVMQEWNKSKGDYKTALHFSDSLLAVNDSIHQMLNAKILNRAVEKVEAERYETELKLLESQKTISRFRFSVLIAVLLLMMLSAALLFNRYRLRQMRKTQLAQKEKERMTVEMLLAKEKLRHAEESLSTYLNTIKEKTMFIESLDTELQRLKEESNNEMSARSIAANREQLLSSTILTDDDWKHFRNLFEQVHPGFLYRLQQRFPDISKADLRLLILTKLGLSSREMAGMLGVSIDAIRKSRYRLRKKLNLDEENALEDLVQQV